MATCTWTYFDKDLWCLRSFLSLKNKNYLKTNSMYVIVKNLCIGPYQLNNCIIHMYYIPIVFVETIIGFHWILNRYLRINSRLRYMPNLYSIHVCVVNHYYRHSTICVCSFTRPITRAQSTLWSTSRKFINWK